MTDIARPPLAHPTSTLVAAGIVTLLALVPISQLKLSSSITESLGGGAAVNALSTLERYFPSSSNILVLLEARDARAFEASDSRSVLLASAQCLAELLPLAPELAGLGVTIEYGADADIASFVESTMRPGAAWYLDESHAQEFSERLTPDGIAAWVSHIEVLLASPSPSGLVVQDLANDPLGLLAITTSNLSRIVPQGTRDPLAGALSKDGTSLLLRIATASAASDTARSEHIVSAVQTALNRLLPDTLQYTLTGSHAVAAYDARHTRKDIIRSLILSMSAVMAVFCVVYRRVSSVLIVAVPLCCSIAWTFAVLSMLGMTLTPPIAVGAAMLAGLNADYAIHYLSAWTHTTSPRDAITLIRRPIIGAALTSIFACAVMLFSEFRLIREFALLGAVGLSCSLIATVTVAPAISSYLTPPRPRARTSRPVSHGPILALMLIFVLAAGAGWQIMRGTPITLFRSSSRVLHPMPNPPLAALDRIAESFDARVWTLPVIVRGATENSTIEKCRRLQQSLENIPSLRGAKVLGIHSLVPESYGIQYLTRLRARVSIQDVATELRNALSASILNPDAFKPLAPYVNSVLRPPPPPSIDDLPPRLRTRLLATNGTDHFALVMVRFPIEIGSQETRADVIADVQRHCDSIGGCTLTGLDVVRLDVEHTLRSELPMLAGASTMAVGLWLVVFFAKARAVACALLPVVFGVGCLILTMFALGIRLDMISVAAIPLLIGIGVDDGIFMVGAARAGSDRDITSALAGSRHAIITTSVTTAGAFGSLVTTTTPAIQTLGLVVALGVLLCLAGTELLLEPLLRRWARKGAC